MAGQLLVNANVGKCGSAGLLRNRTRPDASRATVQPHRRLLLHQQFTQAALCADADFGGAGLPKQKPRAGRGLCSVAAGCHLSGFGCPVLRHGLPDTFQRIFQGHFPILKAFQRAQ